MGLAPRQYSRVSICISIWAEYYLRFHELVIYQFFRYLRVVMSLSLIFFFSFRSSYLVMHSILLCLLHFLGSHATTTMHYRSTLWTPLCYVTRILVYAHLYAVPPVRHLDEIYDITGIHCTPFYIQKCRGIRNIAKFLCLNNMAFKPNKRKLVLDKFG